MAIDKITSAPTPNEQIDKINEIIDKKLENTATGDSSLTIDGTATSTTCSTNIGSGTQCTANYSIAMGNNAKAQASSSTALGRSTNVSGSYGVALGYGATVSGGKSIQLGFGTNSSANSLSVGFQGVDNYQLLDGTTGLIPDARLSSNIARVSDIGALPVGSIITSLTPLSQNDGYVLADGSSYPSGLFPELASYLNQNNYTSTSTYTTVYVPNPLLARKCTYCHSTTDYSDELVKRRAPKECAVRYDRETRTFSNFGAGSYLSTGWGTSNNRKIEIVFSLKYFTFRNSTYCPIFSGSTRYSDMLMIGSDGKTHLYHSSNGTSWNSISNVTSLGTLTRGTKYKVVIDAGYTTSGTYTATLYQWSGSSYSQVGTYTKSATNTSISHGLNIGAYLISYNNSSSGGGPLNGVNGEGAEDCDASPLVVYADETKLYIRQNSSTTWEQRICLDYRGRDYKTPIATSYLTMDMPLTTNAAVYRYYMPEAYTGNNTTGFQNLAKIYSGTSQVVSYGAICSDWTGNSRPPCGLFCYQTDTSTIYFPRLDGAYLSQPYPIGYTGLYNEAGVPNIYGELYGIGSGAASNSIDVFQSFETGTGEAGGSGGNDDRVLMSASRASRVYGQSDTVTPATVNCRYYIVAR